MKDLGEVLCISRVYGEKIWDEHTVDISYRVYIMGIEVEHLWANTTLLDLIKNLTEEEWNLAIMDPEVLCIVEVVYELDPIEDPRPVWKIQELHVQNQKTNIKTNEDPEAEEAEAQIEDQLDQLELTKDTFQGLSLIHI